MTPPVSYVRPHAGLARLASLMAVLLAVSTPFCRGAGGAQRRERIRRQLASRYEKTRQEFVAGLEDLASWCDREKLPAEAERTRCKAKPVDPAQLYLTVIPASTPTDPSDADNPMDNRWRVRFERLNQDYAQKLFLIARGAFKGGLYSLAYDRVREVVEYDPDHRPSRSLLGFTQYKGRWVTPFAAEQLRTGHVWDDRWGWVRKGFVDRYERGMRPARRGWLTADSAASHFKKWRNARDVRSEHFRIKTNASLEHAIELTRQLEDLYAVFFRLFLGYFAPKQQYKVLFESGSKRFGTRRMKPAKPFDIYYFGSRDQYRRYLRSRIGDAADWSAGVYVPAQRRSYFFYDPKMDKSTVTHEATHQLFAEARKLPRRRNLDSDFWVVEGAACYMQNLHRDGNRIVLGSTRSGRLWRARQLARQNKLMRLDDFVGLGIRRFQNTTEAGLTLHYAQATALFHFLMEHDQGRYQEQLVEYIEDVYTGKAGRGRLARRVGESLRSIEKKFLPYITKLDIPGARD